MIFCQVSSAAKFGIGFISELGALLTFPNNRGSDKHPSTTTILARVGVSFISSDQACANAEAEIPDFDFEGTVSQSQAAWLDLLGRVKVDTTGVDAETVSLFYSSVSRSDYTSSISHLDAHICSYIGHIFRQRIVSL